MKTSRRPYHHGNLREALLSAAERAVETIGAGNLTLRELSREIGVSHASPRRHFADRQALLDALAQRGFERLGAALARAARGKEAGFEARLTRFARVHVRFARRHPVLFGLMFAAKGRPDAPDALRQASEEALAPATAIFTDGQARGEVVAGDPARIGLAGYAAVQGLIALTAGGKFKGVPLDTLVGEVIERIVLGLRPRA